MKLARMVPMPEEKTMWKRLENIFVVLTLLFCTGAFFPLLEQGSQTADQRAPNAAIAALQKQANAQSGDPTKANHTLLGGQILVYGVVALLLFRHRRDVLLRIRHSKLLWAVIALAFLSVLWSEVPAFALRRCINLAATSAFGLYLGYRYPPRELLRLLGWTIMITAVGSILVVLLLPAAGIDSALTDYGWKGVFGQKNTLGRLMSLGVLVFLFLAFDSKAHRRAYVAASLLCAGMIVMARSDTSGLVVPILFLLLLLFALSRRRPLGKVLAVGVFALIGIICSLMLFLDAGDLPALVGRDSSLSGRVDIWIAVLPKIMDHPWLGYGYSSFWLGLESRSSADLWAMLGWHVPHSHNGFLDLAEELGVAGLGIFLLGFAVSMRRGLQWARLQGATLGLWPLAYLSFMFLFNLTEGSILRQDNLFWVLYVATFTFIAAETNQLLLHQTDLAPLRLEMLQQPRYARLRSGSENAGVPS